jgi:hypothetical protein
VRNEVLQQSRRKEQPTNNKSGKDNWISHILHWNCLLKHITEGEIEGRTGVKGRQGK